MAITYKTKYWDDSASAWKTWNPQTYDSGSDVFNFASPKIWDDANQVWKSIGVEASSIEIYYPIYDDGANYQHELFDGDYNTGGGLVDMVSTNESFSSIVNLVDGSTSKDSRKLNWSVSKVNLSSSDTLYIQDVKSHGCQIYVNGGVYGEVAFTVTATAPNGVSRSVNCNADCLSVESEIEMADGSKKRLGDLERGETVRTYDPETGEESEKEVAFVLQTVKKDTIEVKTEKRSLELTPDHVCYVRREGVDMWFDAHEIKEGDELMTEDLEFEKVLSVEDGGRTEVSNIEVEDAHVFFADGLFVHNN